MKTYKYMLFDRVHHCACIYISRSFVMLPRYW